MKRLLIQKQHLQHLLKYTDYEVLCRPYLPGVKAVLEGGRYQYAFPFEDAIFRFYTGCLLTRIFYRNQLFSLPALRIDEIGQPYFCSSPSTEMNWVKNLSSLPKGLLIFYFSLLKGLFPEVSFRFAYEDENTNQLIWSPCPPVLAHLINEAGLMLQHN